LFRLVHILAPLFALPVFAQSGGNLPDFSNLSLEELSSVKVTSVSKKEQKLSQVAAAVYVLSQEEIHRSGMTNVADLLRMAPGITVARLDSSTWAVTSRGFNGTYAANVLVLIDGRSVYTPIFGGVYWDMSMPLLDDIDRIEVIRGPGASIWGSNAVTGVINIITKTASDVKGSSVSAGGGTAERGFGQVRYGGNLTSSIAYRTYLSGADHSATQMSNGQSGQDGWSDEQGGFRMDGTTRSGGWLLEADLYQNRREELGYLPSMADGFSQTLTNQDFTGTSASVAFEWRRRLTESSDLKINTHFDYMNRPEPGASKVETRTGEVEVQYHILAPKGNDISVGLDDRLILAAGPLSGMIVMQPAHIAYQVGSGFVQDEIHLAQDRVLVTLGVKLERDYFSGWAAQPTIRALWAPSKHHSIWTAVSRAANTPTIYERNIEVEVAAYPASDQTLGLPVLTVVNGSPQYQSSWLTAYELGYRAQPSPKFSFDIALFYDDHQGLQTQSPENMTIVSSPQPYLLVPLTFTNDVDASGKGSEIAFMYHPYSRWKLAGSYSYLSVNPHLLASAPPGTVSTSESSTPRNDWKIQSYLNLSAKVQLDTLLFSSSSVISNSYPIDVLVPPHTRLDVRLGWMVTRKFEVSLSGQDLLNPRHLELAPVALAVPRDAVRGYYLKTTWRF
jgi:iron complex outermembrane receptor protein